MKKFWNMFVNNSNFLQFFLLVLPRIFLKKVIIFIIKIYQLFISPLLGANKCRFYPTCSEYMIQSIKKNGAIKGFLVGIYRLLRCNPYSKGGYDPL